MKNDFLYIADQASAPEKGWTNAQLANFHYFNPNGLYAAKKARDEQVSKLVEEHGLPSGAILAYGGLNNYTTDRLTKLANQKRVNGITLRTILQMLQKDIDAADRWIEDNNG